ncbi:MAG: 2,3-diphosphoglycerate-dependent phosphoglycerate mutase [Bacteroidales bacterium]|jgi:2,3-bisphosphoglycerate-dependent phosphoglycerate mutase|nr:2,3-diphosphoglycerate-dependent phosphoglycerate mutase [Bacteroidales bacterium]
MYKLVLVRHGQSEWNEKNLFTGWTDVDLTERGMREATEAGKTLKNEGFQFRYAFTSFLKRAIKTNQLLLEAMDLLWIPVEKSWRLNEKHYGTLQGMNKTEMVEQYGAEQVQLWRRSYDVRPPAIPDTDARNPRHDARYQGYNDPAATPGTEALIDTVGRIIPYWTNNIRPKLHEHQQVLVTAHGNSLRGIIKYLKHISDNDIVSLNLPTGIPYVFELDEQDNVLKDYFLADDETLKKLMEEVANQTRQK